MGHLFDGFGAHHITLGIYGVGLRNHAVNQSPLHIGLKNGAAYLLSEQSPVASTLSPLAERASLSLEAFRKTSPLSPLQDGIGMGHDQVGQLPKCLASLLSRSHHHLRIDLLQLPHEPGPPGLNLPPRRSLQNPGHEVEKGRLLLLQSGWHPGMPF